MTDVEVLVVGGGPVGLVAAIEARLAGRTAAIAEHRGDATIDKACGEGLMPGALPLLGRLGVAPHGMPLRGVRYTDGEVAVEHRFTEGDGVGLGVRRTALHAALSARADELGVERIATKVAGVTQDAEGVHAGGIRADWLLAADGLHSGIARELGLARPVPRARRRYGLRRHFRIAPWTDLIEVHWTPVGELYVTPVDDRLVGVAALVPQGVGFDAALASAPTDLLLRVGTADPAGTVMGAGPFRQRTRRRVAGRVLLVGDASGYVDAITGEGLRLGFAQARAAVRRISLGDPLHYEADWFRITKDFRRLTSVLALAATSPARASIVPLAARMPRLFGAAVDRLAK